MGRGVLRNLPGTGTEILRRADIPENLRETLRTALKLKAMPWNDVWAELEKVSDGCIMRGIILTILYHNHLHDPIPVFIAF